MRSREPLARLIYEAMLAGGYTQAELARITGLRPQHISQIINRRQRYRPHALPNNDTMQRLARIPGVTVLDVTRAVRESADLLDAAVPTEMMTGLRRNVHNLVDEFTDGQLAGVLQVLLALNDLLRNGR